MKILVLALILAFQVALAQAQSITYEQSKNLTKRGFYNEYISKDGWVYKVGDKITIGSASGANQFAYIFEGDGAFIPITNLKPASAGLDVYIIKIWAAGTRKAGYWINLRTTGLIGMVRYSIMVENALEAGELTPLGMTSDQALEELKRAKDKLDLGLITQEEFDTIKAELAPLIK